MRSTCRENAGQYLQKTRELFLAVNDYLARLRRERAPEPCVASSSLISRPYGSSSTKCSGSATATAACGLRVRTLNGTVPARYFARDLLGEHRFRGWAAEMRVQLNSLSS